MDKYIYLNSINQNHIRLHQAYGDFTKIVLPDSNESIKAFEKLANETTIMVTRQQLDTYDLRNIEDDHGRFIIINGSYKKMGVITDVGSTIPEMFGYSKTELINRNVSSMMPKIFAEVHDRLLSGFLMNASEQRHDPHRNKIVYVLNKNGYVVPCNVGIYILPSLKEGIRLAGFFTEVDAVLQENSFNEESGNKMPYYIVYDADTHLIQGVSQNCWMSFGISSRLVEGNEGVGDIGIDDLFTGFGGIDLEKLRSEEGLEAVLDTSKLDQYQFISEQGLREIEQDEENKEEDDEGSEILDQGKRFRQARVQLKMVTDTDYFGNRVQVLRFIELDQEGETQRIKSPKHIKQREILAPTERDQSEESASDSLEVDEIGEGSVNTVNEDLKIMKELRILFSNKGSSRAMKVLMVVFGMFFLLLIGLGAFQLVMINKQIEDFSDLLNSVMLSGVRLRTIGELTTIVRQYQTLTWTQTALPPFYVPMYKAEIQDKIATLSSTLSSFQYQIIQATLALNDTSFVSIDTKPFTFELFLDSGVILQDKIYLDGYFQYMTAVDHVGHATLASLVSPQSNVDPTLKALSYATRNGYGPLREGAEMMMNSFNDYFYDRKEYYTKTFLIILIITEIAIAIAAIISIPFGFGAFQTKDKIIALFGYIPVSQIELMVEKGERFKEEYRFETDSGGGLNEESSENNNVENSASQNVYFQKSPNESQIPSNMNESEEPDVVNNIDENIQSPQLNALTLSARSPTTGYRQTTMEVLSARDPLNTNSARFLLTNRHQFNGGDAAKGVRRKSIFDNEKIMDHQEMVKIEDDGKIPKAIRPEKGNRRLVLLGVAAGTLFWILIFIFTYIFFERWFLSQVQRIYSNMKINLTRTSAFVYYNAFLLEEIANVNDTSIYVYPGQTEAVNQRLRFRKMLEEQNSHVLDADILDLPSSFSEYLKVYIETAKENFCHYYSSIASEQVVCEEFASGLNKNGIRMAVLANALLGDTIIKTFRDDLSKIDISNRTQVNSTIANLLISADYIQFATGMSFITPVFSQQRVLFRKARDSFFGHCQAIGVMEFVGVIILSILMYALVWYQSSKGLGDRIIKSKRMLNMMPMELVLHNEVLKERVLSRDIQRVLT